VVQGCKHRPSACMNTTAEMQIRAVQQIVSGSYKTWLPWP
jgi:hypothetical protein